MRLHCVNRFVSSLDASESTSLSATIRSTQLSFVSAELIAHFIPVFFGGYSESHGSRPCLLIYISQEMQSLLPIAGRLWRCTNAADKESA